MEKPHVHPLFRPPPPTEPMEFLCRSWSISARGISKSIAPRESCVDTIHEHISPETEEAAARSINPFSFASSETSMLVLERIMSQPDVSPRTSGRLSHSSGPLNGGLSCGSLSDSPPVSPSAVDNTKYLRPASIPMNYSVSTAANGGGNKNVGRWLKDRKERKKEELRAHNAQIHAAVSVAGVASAIAAIAAATAASSSKDEQAAKTDAALASAATLVAAQCVEAAEAIGAEREHLACVVSSAVNCSSASDIMTLTAAAATALRAATTLKARTLKDVWTVNPTGGNTPEQNFLAVCNRELLSRGCELLKRTRKGDLHWKIVSLYIDKLGQVMLKMKSRHVVGTVTKKKKNVVLELVKDIPAWPGRHLLEGGDQRRYFGLRTVSRGLVEFECKNQREYQAWTQGIARLLEIAEQRNNKHRF